MMDIFKVCLQEISLSGLEGCTLEELWHHLSDRQPPIPFKLDLSTKAYIWSQVISSVTNTSEFCPVLFYQLPCPREPVQTLFPLGSAPYVKMTAGRMEYKHPFPYKFVSVPSTLSSHPALRGSCTTFSQRQDVTVAVASEEIPLSAVEAKYGNSLVLVASQEVREGALIPRDTDPCIDITDIQYSLLEVIGCSRQHGVPRPFVTSKYLKIDARSTFFFVKSLQKKRLITIQNERRVTSGSRSQEVAILFLANFSPPEGSGMFSKEEQFCLLLSDSAHHCRSIKEMKELMGKQVIETKTALIKKGFVEVIQMKDVAEEYANDPNKAHLQACRLLKPYRNLEEVEGECLEDEEDGATDSSSKTPVVAELTLEAQGYRLIDSCGPQGISQADFIGRSGLDLTPFTNRGIVKNLIRKSMVFAILQDISAVRTIRLVTQSHVSKNTEVEQLHAEAVKSGMCDDDLPIVTGKKFFPPKKEKTASKPGDVSEPPNNTHCDTPTPSSASNVELDSSLDSTDSKIPVPDLTIVPPVPFKMTDTKSPTTQDPESSSRKRYQPLMTFKQLKRTRNVLEYFDEHKVITSLHDLCKYVREVELKEGQERVVDSKTIRKLINRLVAENKLCSREATLLVGSADCSQTRSTTLYHTPNATEEEIASAREMVLRAFKAHIHRRAVRLEPNKPKKLKKHRKLKSDFGLESSSEESQEEAPSDLDDMIPIPLGDASYSKFQRLTHFHCYLWILAHGRSNHPTLESANSAPPSPAGQDARRDSDELKPLIKENVSVEEDTEDVYILSKSNYSWALGVDRLPRSSKGPGWLSFFDIIHNLPLSLLMILTRLSSGKIPSRFLSYFKDPYLTNNILYDLPRELKKCVLQGERDSNHVTQCLMYLDEMNLVSSVGNLTRDRSQVYVHLETSASILDTSSCTPRRSFFLHSARPLFKDVPMTIECLAHVERYWFELQSVCLRTPIVLVEKKAFRTRYPDIDPAENDTHPLLYFASEHSKLQKTHTGTKTYNKKGFGAGGLPPFFFSHSSRNWVNRYNRPTISGEHVGDDDDMNSNVSSMMNPLSALYGEDSPSNPDNLPGVGLMDLPHTDMLGWLNSNDDGQGSDLDLSMDVQEYPDGNLFSDLFDSIEPMVEGGLGSVGISTCVRGGGVKRSRREGAPAAKRKKVGIRVSVPSSQVKRNEGGRGKERVKMKKVHKAVKTARKVKQTLTQRYRLFRDISTYIDDDTPARGVGEVRDGSERASWSLEQKNFIFSSYVTSVILHHKGQARVTYTQMRNALMEAFPNTKTKPISSVKRFLNTKLRKNPHLSSILEIRLTECLQEMETMGEDSPEPTFEHMLKFVARRSEGNKSMISPEVLLPDTLKQLYDNYVVIGGSKSGTARLPVLQMEQEVNQALITDLIIATLGADEASYDQYRAFKLFETFPEVEVKAAFDRLRKELIIKSKRARKLGVPKKQSPLETQAYAIAASFYTKLEGQFPPNLIRDLDNFQCMIDRYRGLGSDHTSHPSANSPVLEPGVCWLEEEKQLKFSGDRVKATSVAALLEASCSGGSLETMAAVLPEPLFEETANPDLHDTSDEGEDEEVVGSSSALTTTQLLEEDLEGEDNSDGEDKDEEGERQALTKEMIKRKLHYGTGGVSALFGVGAGGMRYGFVELDLAFSCGKMLTPEENMSCETDSGDACRRYKSTLTDPTAGSSEASATVTIATYMSIEEYVTLCKDYLKFADSDICFTRQLYLIINNSGSNGVQRSSLKGHEALCCLDHTLSLEEHVQFLLSFEMVCVVGVTVDLLVTTFNSGRWHMVVGDVVSNQTLTPYRPWSAIESSDPNMELLDKYRCGVLVHIMTHPGVTLVELADHFSVTLQLTGLKDIIQVLEASGQVRCFKLQLFSKSCTLFERTSDTNSGEHYMEYYEAIIT